MSRISVICWALCCFFLIVATISLADWRLVFHPDRYHGHHVRRGMFFEGWYYNMVLANDSKAIAVIPGVLINDNDQHSFLIIAYGNTSHYFRFPFAAFHSSSTTDEYRVSIKRWSDGKDRINVFSAHEITVDVQPMEGDDATENIQLNLTVSSNRQPDDLSWLIPGTMGPFSWLSVMQCYHHVLSMRHDIHGSIQLGQHRQTNVSGIGYLEKDWGQSFPSTWIWGQANQWISTSPLSASLFFSFAIVPVGFGFELPGFLVIFEHNNQYYRFNSYLLSIVHNLVMDNNSNHLSFTVYDLFFEHKLSVSIQFDDAESGALLYAPRLGRMEKFVKEMLDNNAHFDVRLSQLVHAVSTTDSDDSIVQYGYQEHILFEARTQHVALEMNGNISWLNDQFYNIYGNICPWYFSFMRTLIQHYRLVILLTATTLLLMITSKFTGVSLTNLGGYLKLGLRKKNMIII